MAFGATVRTGAGMDRIGEDLANARRVRRPPSQPLLPARRPRRRLETLVVEPEMRLPNALEFIELAEDQLDLRADPQVRILPDPVLADRTASGRCGREQSAARRLAIAALDRAPAHVR